MVIACETVCIVEFTVLSGLTSSKCHSCHQSFHPELSITYNFSYLVHFWLCQEKKKPTPTKPSDVKRTRRDRTEMENIIFKLFERQPNWALKALVQETDQPEVFFWLFPNSFYKHISTMDDLFFCSLRAHTVIVCPQLCAAISEGDTE